MPESVWSAEETTPAEIEAALRALLAERHADEHGEVVPARVLNLVVVVDAEWRGEVSNRLAGVGRYHASRTVICAVEPGRTKLRGQAVLGSEDTPGDGSADVTTEHIDLRVGPEHIAHLDTIVDPLVISDLPTLLWAPHGHLDAVEALLPLAQAVLLDSVDDPDMDHALHRATEIGESAYVVDLAWLRSTPWRERIAATFDPPAWRGELGRISSVTVRHHPESGAAALLLAGWLVSRLEWRPGALTARGEARHGRAHAARGEVALSLEPDDRQSVRGLSGITVACSSGMELSLDRGDGGLTARRRGHDGRKSSWTILGASRGEAGILGEGIRQALLRDPTYRPALTAADAMLHA